MFSLKSNFRPLSKVLSSLDQDYEFYYVSTITSITQDMLYDDVSAFHRHINGFSFFLIKAAQGQRQFKNYIDVHV